MDKRYQNWFEHIDANTIDNNLKLSGYLWDEYKYRHEHCWNLTFKFTLSVVALGIIPYIKTEIVETVDYWTVIPPLLSIIFSVLGFIQLRRELRLLDHIRNLYRSLQDSITFPFHKGNKGSFRISILIYASFLIAAAILNTYSINEKWIPEVLKEKQERLKKEQDRLEKERSTKAILQQPQITLYSLYFVPEGLRTSEQIKCSRIASE